jgi:glycosyltransferase involved in cell wall biosynthesis
LRTVKIIADIWPSVPEAVELDDCYWLNLEHTYHRSSMELKHTGFLPVTCLLSLKGRSSCDREGITYEFFPIDNAGLPYRMQTSSAMMDFLRTLKPHITVIHLLNRYAGNEVIRDRETGRKKVLQVNTYHTAGTTFGYICSNPRCVDLYLINAPSLKEAFPRDFSISDNSIATLPSAVDDMLFKPFTGINKNWDIVWTGQMRRDDDKRVELLVELVRESGCSMIVVGEGTKRNILQKTAAELGVEDLIYFHDWVPPNELPAILNSASVYFSPSSYDPASRSLSEALSCGLPAICLSDLIGAEKQIIEGYNGFRTRDIKEAAIAIKKLLSDSALYNSMSLNSRELALREFGVGTRTKKLGDLYNKLIEEIDCAN